MTTIFQIEPSQDDLAFPPQKEKEKDIKNLPFSKACMYALEGRKIKRAHWVETYAVLCPFSQNWFYTYDPIIKELVKDYPTVDDIEAVDWEVVFEMEKEENENT